MKIYDGNARLERGKDYIEYSGHNQDCDICGGEKADFRILWSYNPEMSLESLWEYYHSSCWNEREYKYAQNDPDYEPLIIKRRTSDGKPNP